MTVYNEIRVISDPVCLNGTAWWEVEPISPHEQSPATFWIQETEDSAGGGFLYTMRLIERDSVDCEGALRPNLSVGQRAYTLADVGSIPIYAEPDVTTELLSMDDIFTVLDGPVCASSTLWWYVDADGILGWFQGDDGSQHFASITQPFK